MMWCRRKIICGERKHKGKHRGKTKEMDLIRKSGQHRMQRPRGGVGKAYSLKAEMLESLRSPSK